MKKLIIAFSIGVLVSLFMLSTTYILWEKNKMTKIHRLQAPLILASNLPTKNLHLLPAGTTLYFDKSYPEGFTRYKVYINIDRMPLPLVDQIDSTEIDPIDARPFEKADLIKALRDYPLTRQDLEAILKSQHLSNEEVKEVLTAFIATTK